MVLFSSIHRRGWRFLALALVAAHLPASLPQAWASHERPWVADTNQAQPIRSIPLPGTSWNRAVSMKTGAVLVLRDSSAAGERPDLVKIDTGTGQATPVLLSAPGAADRLRAPAIAMASGEDDGLWILFAGTGDRPAHLMLFDPVTFVSRADHALPPEAFTPASRFTDLAIHGDHAYLADEGGAALVALDLVKGTARRFFAGYPSARGHAPLIRNNSPVIDRQGRPETRDLSFLALGKDGAWLYEMTPTGPLYRLSTALLTDPSVTAVELMEGVTAWRGTPTVGGLAIGPDSTLYFTDIANGRLLSFDPGRHPRILFSSPGLVQAGIPAVTNDGQICIPVGNALLQLRLPALP